MYIRLDWSRRTFPMILGLLTLASVGVLLAWDLSPQLFPPRAHDFLGAFPLAMIAIAYLAYQAAHRPARKELFKAILLAIAFLFWSANQLWPNLPQATLFNDIAIALFGSEMPPPLIYMAQASGSWRRIPPSRRPARSPRQTSNDMEPLIQSMV